MRDNLAIALWALAAALTLWAWLAIHRADEERLEGNQPPVEAAP